MIYKKFKSEDQKLFADIFLRNVLDNGIYYALLQQVNHYIFTDAGYINSGMIDNLIKNIKKKILLIHQRNTNLLCNGYYTAE